MNKVRKFWDICRTTNAIGGWMCLGTTIFLFVGAALCPPMFIIDSSILAAAGVLFAFATLWKTPEIITSIEEGKTLTLQHGETSVTVTSRDEENNE